MAHTDELPARVPGSGRWLLIRDILVLQVKLVVDGLRDFLLVPASLIAGLVSLLGHVDGRPGEQFYRLLVVGRRTERWINLFGALRNAPPDLLQEAGDDAVNIDRVLERVESYLVDEYRRGGITRQAKARIDQALRAVQRRSGGRG